MNEIYCSFTELLWRDFFIGKELFYEEKVDGAIVSSSWEIISDLNFVPKTRLLKVKTQSGKVFTMNKDDVHKFKTDFSRTDEMTNKPYNRKKKP